MRPEFPARISEFFGLTIHMYFSEGVPHFHASYGKQASRISFSPLGVLEGGDLPPRALGLAVEWACRHQGELLENWRLARSGKPLLPIVPLE